MALHGIYGSVANQISAGGIPQTGLVAEWPFTTDASDTTGNHDGTLIGDAQIDSGSLLLDGSGDRVNFPNSADFASGTGRFSYQTWINATTISGARNYLSWADGGSTQFATDSGAIKLVMNGISLFSGGTTLSASTWYYLVYRRDDSNNFELLLDKVSDNTATNSLSVGTPTNGNNMNIGAETTALGQNWHGRIGASRYWVGYTLTDTDISNIWDLEKSSYT